MRIARISARPAFAVALAGALFGLAPEAAAQDLFPVVGTPVAYQVDLPVGWETGQDDDMLLVNNDDVMIMVAASDLMAEEGNPLPVSDTEARRIFTQMIIGSDSLLFGLLTEGFMASGAVAEEGLVQEIRTLGGERAGYMRGRFEDEEGSGWLQMHVTMKDGIMYMLAFAVKGDDPDAYAALFTRIYESFQLPDGPT